MSITVSTAFQIHNSPINNSSTKQLYSFPKAQRFYSAQKNEIVDKIYTLPSQQTKRAAGIGYGEKYDFVKSVTPTPPPNQYKIKSQLEFMKEKHLGWTIGVGREHVAQFGIFSQASERIPGPGKYNQSSTLSKIKYTMRPKPLIKTPSEIQNFPGPGTYQPPTTINETARYPVSSYKSYGNTVFNPSSSLRFLKDSGLKVPGPGSYQYQNGIDPKGRYFVSKFGSSKARTFSHDKRQTFANQQLTPGPGNYRLPSEFGYYETAKLHKKSK